MLRYLSSLAVGTSELVSDIHHCEQVRVILVLNDPPLNEKERESMKMYSKVNIIDDSLCIT